MRQELGEGLLWNLAHKSHVTGGLSVTSTVVVVLHCVAYLSLTDRAEGLREGILKLKSVTHPQHTGSTCVTEKRPHYVEEFKFYVL